MVSPILELFEESGLENTYHFPYRAFEQRKVEASDQHIIARHVIRANAEMAIRKKRRSEKQMQNSQAKEACSKRHEN
jgi:hypothetical protein